MPSTWVLIASALCGAFPEGGGRFLERGEVDAVARGAELFRADGVGRRDQRREDLLRDVVDRAGHRADGRDVVAEERCLLGQAPERAAGAAAGLARVGLQLGHCLLGRGRVAVEHLLAGLTHQRPAGLELMLGGQAGPGQPGQRCEQGDHWDRHREQQPQSTYLAFGLFGLGLRWRWVLGFAGRLWRRADGGDQQVGGRRRGGVDLGGDAAMQGRRSAVGVLDVEVGALVGPDRAAARGYLLDDCLQAGAGVDVGQVSRGRTARRAGRTPAS